MSIWQVWTPHEYRNFQCVGLIPLPEDYNINDVHKALVDKGFLYEDSAGKISMTRDTYTAFVHDSKTGAPLYNLYSVEYIH